MRDQIEFWVRSDVMPDGSYGASISIASDAAFTLEESAAATYSAACFREALAADHCAATMRLLTEKLGMPAKDAAEIVRMCAISGDQAATAPMTFVGAVGRAKHPRSDAGRFIPVVLVRHDGDELGFIDPEQLRDHAAGVLSAVVAARLDDKLFRTLTEAGIGESHARAVVADLAEYMPDQEMPDA